jgi:hypothetical protein
MHYSFIKNNPSFPVCGDIPVKSNTDLTYNIYSCYGNVLQDAQQNLSGIKCRNSVSYMTITYVHACLRSIAILPNIYCAKYFGGPHTFRALFALVKQAKRTQDIISLWTQYFDRMCSHSN